MPRVVIRGLPFTETPAEIPDGIRTDFSTSTDFVPGTVSVWINGVRKVATLDDGFEEIPPSVVRLKEPPVDGDVVAVRYEQA